ncbi:MAG: cell division protein FtsW [Gaiellales bacterium]|nr:cell division protein FtsW [Gaiellales bacterium]
MSRTRDQARGAEQLLVIVAMALVAFGVVMVYSASSSFTLLEHHAVYAGLGLAALWLLARRDYRHMAALAPSMLVVATLLLLLVFAAGVERNGAQRWLSLPGGFTLQPSELAKVALCVFGAAVLSGRKHAPRDWREAMRPVGAAAAIMCGLIVITDLGSAIAVGLAAAAVLIASGAAAGALARLALAAGALAGAMIAIEPYRMQRLTAFLHPGDKIGAAGYQLYEAKLALGTGGLFGVGLGQSVTKLNYLPEAHTDMIVPIVGEELGLIGVFGLLVAFGLLAWCGYSVALRAKDPFGKLLAAGLTTLITGQAVLNIGGTLGVLPFTGVPVPLISYGGTSLIATLAAIGFVLSVGTHGGQALRVAEPVRSKVRKPAARRRTAARPQAAARPATAGAARARRRRAM